MAKLIYSAIASLDGYVEDADGRFDWAVVSRGSELAPSGHLSLPGIRPAPHRARS
jgi:hypothetical protein